MSNININRDYIATVDVKKSTVSTSGNMKFYITDINTSNIYFKLVIDASSNRYVGSYGQKENSDDYRLFLRVIDPNNKPFTIDAERMDKPDNFFVVDLKENQKDQIGIYRCELFIETEINGRLERSTTNGFTYEVVKSIMNDLDEIIEDDPDFSIIDTFATKEYVDNLVFGGEIKLDGYVTDEELSEALANIPGGGIIGDDLVVSNIVATNSISMGRKEGTAIGAQSIVIGYNAEASGPQSHAEGFNTIASGFRSHAEGDTTRAIGYATHTEGTCTVALGSNQHVQGKHNIKDEELRYAHIVGNGDMTDKSNCHTLDWDGNGWYQGNLYVGGTSQDNSNKVLSTADIKFTADGKLSVTINGVTKTFSPD